MVSLREEIFNVQASSTGSGKQVAFPRGRMSSARLPVRHMVMRFEAGIDTSAHAVGHARACYAVVSVDAETEHPKRRLSRILQAERALY